MLISYKWLQKFLPNLHQYEPETIASALTETLAEVESITEVRKNLQNIVVGEVLEVNEHPNNPKLHLCKVDNGQSTLNIVCGAPNVAKGQKVALCLIGGSVNDPKNPEKPFKIVEKEISGVVSNGMICSPKELGLYDDHEQILVLESEIKIGTNIADLLHDIVFEIENKSISHRGDCFSHLGIARELAAIFHLDLLAQPSEEIPVLTGDEDKLKVEIKVSEELCTRFSAILLREVQIKDSPLWLKAHLSAVGAKPINNVVDITNYVMFDRGQPLHAYDFDKLKGKKLVVRTAKEEEEVITLDEKKHKLDKEVLVISDSETVEDIAGIMGGAKTQITSDTKTIILEAANFNMYNIRKSSRKLGIRTEASTRFEKGIDPNNTIPSLKSAVKLILDIAEAEVGSELFDVYPTPRLGHQLALDYLRVNRFLGVELTKLEVVNLLESLGLEEIEQESAGGSQTNQLIQQKITFAIPSFRADLKIQEDLLEEVARLYRYAQITPDLPLRSIKPTLTNKLTTLTRNIRTQMIGLGLDELMTYSFVNEQLYSKALMDISKCAAIVNPLSPELSHMRNSILPSLVEKVALNSKTFPTFKLFEIARGVSLELDENKIHKQPHLLSGVTYNKTSANEFTVIKSIIQELFAKLALEITLTKAGLNGQPAHPMFHPARASVIQIDGLTVGIIGELHPRIATNFELPGRIGGFELNLTEIMTLYNGQISYKTVSTFPEVVRDISFWTDINQEYSHVLKAITELNLDLLSQVEIEDVFLKAEENKKSLTLSIHLQSSEKTLTEDDIKSAVDKIVTKLQKSLKIELRDK